MVDKLLKEVVFKLNKGEKEIHGGQFAQEVVLELNQGEKESHGGQTAHGSSLVTESR